MVSMCFGHKFLPLGVVLLSCNSCVMQHTAAQVRGGFLLKRRERKMSPHPTLFPCSFWLQQQSVLARSYKQKTMSHSPLRKTLLMSSIFYQAQPQTLVDENQKNFCIKQIKVVASRKQWEDSRNLRGPMCRCSIKHRQTAYLALCFQPSTKMVRFICYTLFWLIHSFEHTNGFHVCFYLPSTELVIDTACYLALIRE